MPASPASAHKAAAAGYIVPLFSCTGSTVMAFCRPRIDAQIGRARALQLTDPRAANALSARIERAIVDQALSVPLVNVKNVEFTSRRLGNYQFHPLYSALLDQVWVR